MTEDVLIRVIGCAGRITLNRPMALNALTHDMVRAVDAALDAWREDTRVALVVIDAAGDKAFCAGGDIARLYATGKSGDFAYGQRFWRDEYRMNAKIADYAKPVVSFLHGFTMGGGVGIGCHAAHRIVCESTKIAMPECGIGLIPDVGGTLLLARAPGRVGEFLGLTGARMGPGDTLYAGFADRFVSQDDWPELVSHLERNGDLAEIASATRPVPPGRLAEGRTVIDTAFENASLKAIVSHLQASDHALAQEAADAIRRNSPLSMACTCEVIRTVRDTPEIQFALTQEYRVTSRSMEHGDFLEGIRAAIIDKDRQPVWRHADPEEVTQADIERLLAPREDEALIWENET